MAAASDGGAPGLDARRLFVIANLSILMIGLGFAVRANVAGDIQERIFAAVDLASSGNMIGGVLGATFTGFALTLLFGSALVDHLGMKRMLLFAAFGFIAGSLVVIATSLAPPSGSSYPLIFAGFLLTGLGWGAVEAASNPLVTALFPEEKTHRLNVLHAWWPAGIVIGGLLGVGLGALGVPWQWNLAMLIVPAAVLALLAARTPFPVTERVAAGVSHRDMYAEVIRSPGCFVWFGCMMLTATTELAPGQWVEVALTNMVGMPGILVLVYVSALMFVLRHFAGRIVQHLAPVGLLWFSSLTAAIGLYLLSVAESPVPVFLAATVWGAGVCYMYPTMVASVAERYPRGGAFVMGIMGFAAGMANQVMLPIMGSIFDRARIEAAGGEERLAELAGPALDQVIRLASIESFRAVAVIPLLLLPVFGLIWLNDRRRRAAEARVGAPLEG
ncbi:MAG TPA: MFS transporter [Gammaproteobacteria bacterium]